jgi:hypothetical protein
MSTEKSTEDVKATRKALLSSLSTSARKLVEQFISREGKSGASEILTKWDHGADVAKIMANPDEFGIDFVTSLATLTGESEDSLYAYRNFSQRFKREHVAALAERVTARGTHLTWKHFRVLLSVEDRKAMRDYLNRAFEEGLSANQLEVEVAGGNHQQTRTMSRGGGRKPAKPSSVGAGLRQIVSVSQSLVKRADVWDDAVCKAVLNEDPAKLDEDLATSLVTAAQEVDELVEALQSTSKSLHKSLAHVEQVLEKRKQADKGDGKPSKAAAPHSRTGTARYGKAKKAKAKPKRQIQTVG